MIIPSIDLFDGKAVQWRQGREPVLERPDVFELLDRFSLCGEVAVIDLNAATGKGSNRELIKAMLRKHDCRVGGGIRSPESARAYLKAGASRIILGTCAREPWVRKLPKETLVFALDSKGDELLTHGWREGTGRRTAELVPGLAAHCSEFLYTQVEKEGMMAGLDRERVETIVKGATIPVTVAGGITTLDDIRFLNRLGANAQIGMALYTGKLDLDQCFLAGLDFAKTPLIPTIVQDIGGDVVMLAYSNTDSLKNALKERRGIYFSRSRKKIWRKGETSGNVQELVRVDSDCDGDTLLFQVRQTNHACHLNRWSCFPRIGKSFDLTDLDRILGERKRKLPGGSYSAKLFGDESLRAAKLREETEELIEAQHFDEVRWETADLLYFALVEARAHGVSLDDIIAELRSRHGNH